MESNIAVLHDFDACTIVDIAEEIETEKKENKKSSVSLTPKSQSSKDFETESNQYLKFFIIFK